MANPQTFLPIEDDSKKFHMAGGSSAHLLLLLLGNDSELVYQPIQSIEQELTAISVRVAAEAAAEPCSSRRRSSPPLPPADLDGFRARRNRPRSTR